MQPNRVTATTVIAACVAGDKIERATQLAARLSEAGAANSAIANAIPSGTRLPRLPVPSCCFRIAVCSTA